MIADENVIPFSEEVFQQLSATFKFLPEYLYLFLQSKYTPLHVTLPTPSSNYTSESIIRWYPLSVVSDQALAMVFQSPLFKQFSTLVLSYDASARITCGFLGYNDTAHNLNLIEMLLHVHEEVGHPLLVPTLFYLSWIRAFTKENDDQKHNVSIVRKVTGKVAEVSRGFHDFEQINQAHDLIIRVHNTLNNSMGGFVAEASHNLERAFSDIEKIVPKDQMAGIQRSNQELRSLMSVLNMSRTCATEERLRIRERLHLQLQVVCS